MVLRIYYDKCMWLLLHIDDVNTSQTRPKAGTRDPLAFDMQQHHYTRAVLVTTLNTGIGESHLGKIQSKDI